MDPLRRLFVVLASGAVAFSSPSLAQPGTNYSKLRQVQPELLKSAREIAAQEGKKLSLAHDSVQVVESILAGVHTEYRRTKDNEGLFSVAFVFGAHIVAVIEHNLGPGVWERDHPVLGKDSFPFTLKDQTITPVHWCLKRILDGPADNVWVKYQALVLGKMK